MAKRKSSTGEDILSLIFVILVIAIFAWSFRSLIISWLINLFDVMVNGLISFVIGVVEFLLLVILPIYLGYLAGVRLLEERHITSGWGIILCVIFLYIFSNFDFGYIGLFIGFIVWGILGTFTIDKWNDSGIW